MKLMFMPALTSLLKDILGGIRQRQKPQAPTPQAPVRNRQTRKVANAKVCMA